MPKDWTPDIEPVVSGSIVFRGFPIANYESSGHEQPIKFQIEEWYFGLPPSTDELEVPIELDAPIARGEELIVSSFPDESGPNWSVEPVGNQPDDAYLKYLRGLALGKAPARILGWTTGPGDSFLAGVVVKAVGAGHEYEIQSDKRGTFELSGVAPGKYRLSARREGYESSLDGEEVEVVPAGCAVVAAFFNFEGTIRGTIRNRHGEPEEHIRVDLLQITGEGDEPFDSTETDSEGKYEFRHVDPGRYRAGVPLISGGLQVRRGIIQESALWVVSWASVAWKLSRCGRSYYKRSK